MPPSLFDKVRQDFDRMPQRGVLDFLVQYQVRELNWSVYTWLSDRLLYMH